MGPSSAITSRSNSDSNGWSVVDDRPAIPIPGLFDDAETGLSELEG